MKTTAYLGLVLGLGLGACSADDREADSDNVSAGEVSIGACVDVNGDGQGDGTALDANTDGVAESIDNDGDKKPDDIIPPTAKVVTNCGNPGAANGGNGNGSNGSNGDVPISGTDEDGGQGGGSGNGGTGVVVDAKATVMCGDSQAAIDVSAGYVCCDSLMGDTWATPNVKSKAMCNSYMGGGFGGGPTTDTVGSACDGKDDCGTSFCCFVYNTMGPPASAVARAHGRRCLSEASCNAAGGIEGQSGVFSCNSVKDCPSVFTQCVAEPKGVTSANKSGRRWVKVCQ